MTTNVIKPSNVIIDHKCNKAFKYYNWPNYSSSSWISEFHYTTYSNVPVINYEPIFTSNMHWLLNPVDGSFSIQEHSMLFLVGNFFYLGIGKKRTAGNLVFWITWPAAGHLDTSIFKLPIVFLPTLYHIKGDIIRLKRDHSGKFWL